MEDTSFILGFSSGQQKHYVVHMNYPRFILDMDAEEIEWMEDVSPEELSPEELEKELMSLCQKAVEFYNDQLELLDEQ